VAEGGLRYRTGLTGRLDTGFFPDRRLLRARLRKEAAGKTVLNLFSCTCSFSVCAAAGGARAVDSVDMSGNCLDWGMANFSLNGLAGLAVPDTESLFAPRRAAYRFIRADVLHFLPEAERAGLSWDIIILDPPVFSNSAKMRGSLDILRDQREILRRSLALLSPGGRLYFSVNARRFHLEGEWPGFSVKDITGTLRDEDFRDRRIPFTWIFGQEPHGPRDFRA
jgi:23S rRNA G2069 N7-methylase RlmK/C1962 C5-methylase RlmI